MRPIQGSPTQFQGKPALDISEWTTKDEVQNYEKIGPHNNIPQLYKWYTENGTWHMVIECLDGAVDFNILKTYGLHDFRLLHLVQDAKATLAHVHKQGVAHRNLVSDHSLLYQPLTNRFIMAHFIATNNSEEAKAEDRKDLGVRLFKLGFDLDIVAEAYAERGQYDYAARLVNDKFKAARDPYQQAILYEISTLFTD